MVAWWKKNAQSTVAQIGFGLILGMDDAGGGAMTLPLASTTTIAGSASSAKRSSTGVVPSLTSSSTNVVVPPGATIAGCAVNFVASCAFAIEPKSF